MTNLKVYHDKLANLTNQTLTTKELKDLGISKHFINRLMEKGKLERVKRGTYLVKSLNKGKSKQQYLGFHYFQESVSIERYDMAYRNLMNSYVNRVNHDYDNDLRISFILLREILGNKYDFRAIDDLQELNLKKGRENINWNNFCLCVVNHDYEGAKTSIEKVAKSQIKKNGQISPVTQTMQSLINKIFSFKESKGILYTEVERLNNLISEGKYEEALSNYEEIANSIKETKIKEKYISLIELIKTIIAFKNDNKLVLDHSQMAIYASSYANDLLTLYLRDKNYLKALDLIERVYHEYPYSYNKLVKKLLFELKTLNANNRKDTPKINGTESYRHFKNFLNIFSLDNIEDSISELSLCVAYGDPENENYSYNCSLLKMLDKLNKMRTEGEILEDKNISYNLNDAPINNFNRAIELEDYKKANAFMHLVQISDSVVFEIRKQILEEIIRLDKVNKVSLPAISEPKTPVQDIKETKPEETKPQEEKPREHKPIVEIDEEARKKAETIDLTYENIYNLIYNREYDVALALVNRENKGELNRLCNMSSRLIKQIQELESGILKSYRKKTELTGNKFKDFYQALNDLNYEDAYSIANELTQTIKDPEEFEVYKLLLEDLKELRLKVENAKNEIEDLGDQINALSVKQTFTREDIEDLINLLDRKIELEISISKPCDRDLSLLNIANMTILSLDGKLNDTDFASFICEEPNNRKVFIEAIDQGDYPTAQTLIGSIDWKEIGNMYSFSFLRLAKKMLNIMIPHLRKVRDLTVARDKIAKEEITEEMSNQIEESAQELLTDEDKIIYHKLVLLKTIRPMIKNRQYEEVFKKVLETKVPFNHEFDPDILGNLAFIKSTLDHQANELYDKYLDSLESCSVEESQRYLSEYKDFLIKNYMEDTKNPVKKSLTPED